MILDPGELDERIVIEQEVRTPDGSGGQTKTWQAVFPEMWAKVRPKTGTERTRSDQVQAESMYMVFIRNREVLESYRVRWVSNGDLILNIRHVGRRRRAQFIQIEAELGVTQ